MRRARWLVAVAALIAAAVTACQHQPDDTRVYGVWVYLDPLAAQSDLAPVVGPDATHVFDNDRPVNPDLVARIAATGAEVRYASRWLRAVSVNADRPTLKRLRGMKEVVALRPIADAYPLESAPGRTPSVTLSPTLSASPFTALSVPPSPTLSVSPSAESVQDSAFYGQNYAPLRELNIPVLHTLGFTGTGQKIAIFDTGFNLRHETVQTLPTRIERQRDFINRDDFVFNEAGDPVSPNQERHGTFVFSLLGGYKPNVFVGGAFGATFYLAKVDVAGVDTKGDEDRWIEAMEWAHSFDVKIVNSSIGFRYDFIDRDPIPYGDLDGNTTATTLAADEAARRGILVVVAIGDGRPQTGTLVAPSDADSVLVVGGLDSVRASGAFAPSQNSNRGPTGNGRIKPDVVARGERLIAASADNPLQYEGGLAGSSFATPLITAGAALYREAWPDDPIGVRQAFWLAGTQASRPDNQVGRGRPDIAAAVMMPDGLQTTPISTDVQGRLTTVRPFFSWFAPRLHPKMLPVIYRLEIARDSNFVSLIYADTITGSFQLTTRIPLRPAPRAYWRVIATSPLGVRRVTLPQPMFVIPHWVTLLTLTGEDDERITDARPQLAWTSLANPDRFTYDVQILTPGGAVVQTIPNLTTSTVRVPTALTANQSYRWRVIARTGILADTVESGGRPFLIVSSEAPPATLLYPTFPNPFRVGESARIWFDIARAGSVELSVHDSRGLLVRNLIPAHSGCPVVRLLPGLYGRTGQQLDILVPDGCALTEWDGKDGRGATVARGVYVLRLRTSSGVSVQRMVYLPN